MNIKDLDNVMYNVIPTKKSEYNVRFIDFSEGVKSVKAPPEIKKIGIKYPDVMGPDIWEKSGILNSLIIEFEEGEVFNMMDILKEQIRKSFIEKIKDLGELNRTSKDVPPSDRFDLNMIEFKKKELIEGKNESESIARRMLPQIIRCGSMIAHNGRIGPGNYLLMNKNTYEYLEPFFQSLGNIYYNNDQFDDFYKSCRYAKRNPLEDEIIIAKFSSFDIIIDEGVDDDRIIMGRKNEIDMPGVIVPLLTDEEGNVSYEKKDNKIELKYKVVDIGFFPERQYYSIHITK